MKAIIQVEAKTTAPGPHNPVVPGQGWHGQDWSPLTESHIRFLVGEAMKRTGLRWEIVSVED